MKKTGTLTRLPFVFSLLFCFFILTISPINLLGQYVVNFEGPDETKTGYATGTVNLSGLDWDLTEALIGTSGTDWKNGARSSRMRGYATTSISMLENKANGMGTLSFQYRRYGTDPQVDWKAEYSIDNGASWIQVGSDFTAPESDDVQTFSEAVNVSGNVRVRIKRATDDENEANRRLNIDDITMTDFAEGSFPPSITNIVQTPSANITPEITVSVSADVQQGSAAIDKVELRWGISAGNHPNTINMAAGSGNTFTTANDIPAQNDGTTVYYIVYADGTDDESAMSAEQSYEVKEQDPIEGHLETFDLSNATASYGDNSFTGDLGFTWSFIHSRDEGAYPIDGKGLMLRRSDEPSSLSATIPGGIGSFSVDTRKAFTGNTQRKIELVINGGVVKQFEPAFGEGADDTVIPFVVENINTPGNVEFMLRMYGATGNQQIVIDNIRWTSYSGDGNTPPAITNITQTPATDITSSTTVSVSADVTDTDGTVEKVELRWGTATGNRPNTIVMNAGTDNTYTTATAIPAQTSGITVYYVVYAEDDEGDSSVSGERSYTVQDPLTTTLPYTNTFDTRLGEVYVYNASGPTRTWAHRTAADNGYAEMNGFGGSPLEEDWLILPGINMNDYETAMMTFDTYWQYGEDDENNYLKLLYSADYAGIGNTAEATWHELSFNASSTPQAWAESGTVNLSDISGEKVFIAFKYRYETGKYRLWRVDNISLSEVAQPILQAMPSYISQYTYEVDEGPSDIYAFALSGTNLDGSNVSLAVPDYFEIAFTDQVFGANLTLEEYDGIETTILTRMKAGLNAGTYEEQITISGGGAEDIHLTLSGVVTAPAPPPPGLPYTQNFESFVFENGTEIPHFGEDQEWTFMSAGNQLVYQGDWGTGFSAGFRGNANLMGYQHTGTTDLFVAMLKLENNTEEEITALNIAYTGKVERASEGRITEWMVMINNTEVPALHYSTEDGMDKNISATVEGLNILPGEVFTISWGSERGGPSGSSRQIGIAGVSVEAAEPSDIISATISPDEFVFEDFPDAENYVTTITWNDASEVTRVYVVLNDELDLTYQVEDIDGLTATLTMMVPAKKMQALKSGSVEVDGYVVFDKGLPAHFRVIYTNPVFEVEVFVLNDETGNPVAEATVYVQETEETSVTDGSGLAVFFLNAGDYTLNIAAEGYVSLMNHPIAVIADPQADHTFEVRLVPGDDEDPDPLALPYYNPLRTNDDYAAALEDGFSIHEATQTTTAGGYLRIFPDGYIQSPPIMLADLGGLSIAFDATTFGGTTGQTLSVKVSDDGGNSFSTLGSYEITGSYVTYEASIDPEAYTSESVVLRVEMTAGTNSTRLREMHIYDPLAEYMVSFTVTDGEEPIEGALITIGEASQTTGADGTAGFSLLNGDYTYNVTAEGYQDITDGTFKVMNLDLSVLVVMEPLVLAALEVIPDALSGFAYDLGDGPSDAQPFVLSGEGLDGTNVTIDAPASFEIGLEEANSFSSVITLEAYDGSETTIQVRLKAGLEAGTYSGEEVIISGGGAEAISVSLEGVVLAPQTPLALPYYNPLRSQDDYDAAIADDFSIHEATQATAAGGYLRIFPDGYIQSPPIMLADLGGLSIAFDATTFGGTTGQTLSVKVSDDGGISFSDIQAYEIPGSYETFETAIDLQTYTSESVILRLEMTAGTNSTRLRELHILDPEAEYMVHFTVTDGENPIAGATITIGEESQTTNTEGMAEFSLPNGTYSYSVTAEGYDNIADVQLSVTNDDVTETVAMTRTTYTINASAGDNGSIDPSGEISVDHGEDQVFAMNPNENHHVAFVKVDGADINLETDNNWNAANRQYTFSNVTQNHTIEAGFAINTYTIEASAGNNGSIDPSGEISVNHGGNQVFTINPNQGYRISFVKVNGSNINLGTDGNWNAANRQYTFSNVTQNHTIEAGFEVDDTGLTTPELAELKIYPNPVADILYIESDDQITRLEIIDMTGRLVYREEPSAQQLSIDATALYNGIYFVRIITPAGMTTKRIQVAR